MSERKDIRRWNALNWQAQAVNWDTHNLMADFQNADFLIGDDATDIFVLLTEARQKLDEIKRIFKDAEISSKRYEREEQSK